MVKLRTARRVENGNFLIVTRRRPIDPDLSRIDSRPRWRDQPGRATGASGEQARGQQTKNGIPFHHLINVLQLARYVPQKLSGRIAIGPHEALHTLAPKGSEPPFAIAQGIVLVFFVLAGILSVKRFYPVAV
jgi:hypothetical protein